MDVEQWNTTAHVMVTEKYRHVANAMHSNKAADHNYSSWRTLWNLDYGAQNTESSSITASSFTLELTLRSRNSSFDNQDSSKIIFYNLCCSILNHRNFCCVAAIQIHTV